MTDQPTHKWIAPQFDLEARELHESQAMFASRMLVKVTENREHLLRAWMDSPDFQRQLEAEKTRGES